MLTGLLECYVQLHHADEESARQLAAVAASGIGQDESNVLTDTGWFELENTRFPTAEDLAVLQQHLGDTGALVRTLLV